jgi:hypothetical protein
MSLSLKAVFVHLGSAKAEHLWANLKRFNCLFPQIPVVIILDDSRHLPKLKSLDVEAFIFSRTDYVGYQLGTLNYDPEFRNGFWRFSIERFMALNAWHQGNPQESFVHFESDVILMPDFPWKNLAGISTLAWLRFNSVKDVAAILFSPNSDETRWLADLVCLEVAGDPDLTDMTALSLISHTYASRVMILPTLASELIPRDEVSALQHISQIAKNVDLFGGMFDAAAIGMWLTGQDPRNHLGWIKRYIPLFDSYVDPSIFRFVIGSNGCVTVTFNGKVVSLFNLHVHSKQLSFFGQNWESRLRADIESSGGQRHSQKLYLRIVFIIVRDYLSRNKILSLKSMKAIREFKKASE